MKILRNPVVALPALALLAALGCAHGTPSPSGFEVVSFSPTDGTTGAASNTSVQITFTLEVSPTSVVGTHNIVVVNSKNQLLNGTFTVSGAQVTFKVAGTFDADETIGVAVKRTVYDLQGVPLRYPRAIRFSTGDTLDEIEGFPPFDEYPLPPDTTKITAEIRGTVTEVRGSMDAVQRPGSHPVNVNVRNLTQLGDWEIVFAATDGSFQVDMTGVDEGDQIEINASFPNTGKVGPSVLVTAVLPFLWGLIGASGTPPSARQGHASVRDSASNRMIVFGGCESALGFGSTLNDVFALSLSDGSEAWTELTPGGALPPSRWGHTAVFDPTGNRMIVFGGDTGLLGVLNDAWVLDLAAGSESWAPVIASGTPPAPRALHLAVFDAIGSRMLLFGGRSAQGLNPTQFDDLFALNFPATGTPSWETLTPSGVGPTARNGAFGVLDAGGNRIVAGFGNTGALSLPDAYTLDLGSLAWSPILSVPTTTGRASVAATLDTLHQRVLVFGGGDMTASYDDLFAFDLGIGSWSTLQPEGTAPSPRSNASMIFDPVAGRAILFGGTDLSSTTVYDGLYQLR